MNIKSPLRIHALALLTTLLSLLPAQAAVWISEFSVPPYTKDAPVTGTGGWTAANSSSADENAVVVAAPWNPGGTTLRLEKTASGDNRVRLYNNSFTPYEGKVRVTIEMAFDFNPSTNPTAVFALAFANLAGTHSPLTVGVNFGTNGGLYYQGSSAVAPPVVFLPKTEIKLNSIYTFTLDIDVDQDSFDLTVTGTRADNTALHHHANGIETRPFNNNTLNYLYLENGGNPGYIAYVDQISIQPIPEPSAAAFLLGGGLVGIGYGLRRRRKAETSHV